MCIFICYYYWIPQLSSGSMKHLSIYRSLVLGLFTVTHEHDRILLFLRGFFSPFRFPIILYGGVELLDFLPQSPRLLLHLVPLLLQLSDVVHRLLQGRGVTDLIRTKHRGDHFGWVRKCSLQLVYTEQQCNTDMIMRCIGISKKKESF